MKHSVILFVLFGLNSLVGAEYVDRLRVEVVEEGPRCGWRRRVCRRICSRGSGGQNPDDEDYDYSEDYADENLLTPVNNNIYSTTLSLTTTTLFWTQSMTKTRSRLRR